MGLLRLHPRAFFLLSGLMLLVAGCSTTNQMHNSSVDPSVVALIDQEPVSVSEFEREYARTVGDWEAAADDSMAAYRDFLNRYVNFRLKVRAAKAAGYENDPSVRSEMANYRNNFARPQLIEQEVLRPLARDLYEKQQELVDVSHILISAEQNAAPEDTLEAYRTIQTLKDSLDQGADFGELALRHSDDPSAARQPNAPGYRGRLGPLPPGRVVKKFEDVAYSTQPGNYSAPFRTRYGYHIVKVHERRPAPPKIRVAHIMLRSNQSAADSTQLLNEAQQLQDSLKAGVSFEDLARRHSDDPRSARRGGALGNEISYHTQLPESFKEAAFNLAKIGDVSEPVRTRFGYHLIKLLDRTAQPSFEEAYESLKKRLEQMPRYEQARERLTQRILRKHGATVDTTKLHTTFARADSALQDLVEGNFHGAHPHDTIATLGDSAYVLRDLHQFAQNKSQLKVEGEDQALQLTNQFLADKALTYQTHVLETSDNELSRVMQEFRNGTLLFQLMEDSVWTAAQQDTMGLRSYYRNHASEYRYPERIRAIGFVSSSDSLLEAVNTHLTADRAPGELIEEFRADSTAPVRIDTVLVTDSTNSVFDRVRMLDEGAHTDVLDYQRGSRIIVVHDGVLPPREKTFKEARPEVVNDYQEVLEDRLIERLRNRYEVHLYPEHLTGAFEGPKPEDPVAPAASR